MKGLLAALLVASLAFAGCAGKSDPTATTTSTTKASTASATATAATTSAGTTSPATTSTTASSSSAPSAGSKGPNQAPMIHSFSAARANVTTLAFTFSFDGMDPDGDNVTWSLLPAADAAAIEGAQLPGMVNFTYATAGLFNATLTVSDGMNSTMQTLAVNATLGTHGPLYTAKPSWVIGSAACQAYPQAVLGGGPQPDTPFKPGTPAAGVLYGELLLPANLPGHDYTADFGAAAASGIDAAQVGFYDSAGSFLGQGYAGFTVPFGVPSPYSGDLMVVGTIPGSAAYAMFTNCGNPMGVTVAFVVAA